MISSKSEADVPNNPTGRAVSETSLVMDRGLREATRNPHSNICALRTLQRLDDRERCPRAAKQQSEHDKRCATISLQGCPSVEGMEPIAEDDKTQEAVEQTKHEYNSVAAQYSKMNRHASAEHVELLLAAMPRGLEEQRRRIDAEARIPELQKRVSSWRTRASTTTTTRTWSRRGPRSQRRSGTRAVGW